MSCEYSLTKPCDNCPFRTSPKAVRLTHARAEEIGELDGEFPCHKTTTAGGADGKNQKHCAGFLIYRMKDETPSQMMRIAGRLGIFDPDKLDPKSFDEVVDCWSEMIGG